MTAAVATTPFTIGAPRTMESPTLLNLLIVDDERSVRDACREVASALGYRASSAESAEQALAIATGIRHAACTAAALRGLGIAWETAGKPARAEEAFQDSLTAAEGNPFFAAWASARLGACLARQGRPLEAAPHVRAALSAGPPLTRYEARWAHAELLAARNCDRHDPIARQVIRQLDLHARTAIRIGRHRRNERR